MNTLTVIVCLLVLAAVCAGGYYYFKAQGKKEEEPKLYDFCVDAFHTKRGWFGVIFDKGAPMYTYINNLSQYSPVKKNDRLRVKITGYVDGNYVAEVVDLSNLPKNTIVITYQAKNGQWHCMFAGPEGIAFVGQVLSDSKIPLKANQQWRAIKHNDGYFSLT